MLSCTVDSSEYDMEEILDVLSVPEIKEILKEFLKCITTKANPKIDRNLYKNF